MPNSSTSNACCTHCGAKFVCEVSNGNKYCWCFDLPHQALDQAAAKKGEIKVDQWQPDNMNAAGCLCPACLQALIKQGK